MSGGKVLPGGKVLHFVVAQGKELKYAAGEPHYRGAQATMPLSSTDPIGGHDKKGASTGDWWRPSTIKPLAQVQGKAIQCHIAEW